MARIRPFLTIVQSKGGVGATTLALAVERHLPAPSALIETSGDGVLASLVEGAVDAGRYLRLSSGLHRELAMHAHVERLRVACEPVTLALYGAPEVARFALAAANTRFVVCDAGRAPDPDLLAWATHVWVVVTPDVRSVAQAERFLSSPGARPLHGRATVVETFAAGPSLVEGWPFPVLRLPRFERGLKRGAFDAALEAALAPIFPRPAKPDLPGDERGILRGLFAPKPIDPT